MKTWKTVDVVCPFYKDADNEKIKCEGLFPGGSINVVIKNRKKYEAFFKKHCCDKYSRCAVAEMLTKKYLNYT